MDNGRELIEALAQVSHEKGIDKEIIYEAIEASLVAACKRQLNTNANISVVLNRETGKYTVLTSKTVSAVVNDSWMEISLDDARKIDCKCEMGDILEIDVTPSNFGRIAAQNAKQVVVQKFREAERELLYNEYIEKEHQVIIAIVQRRDRRNIIVSLGKLEAIIPPSEQMPRESYQFNDRIKVYVTEVKQSNKGPIVNVSRTCPELLQKLFEQEVPEISDGIVEIKSVAREAGNRSKIAVYTKHPHVDPIGSCVGHNGQRVNVINSELRGEKLDIILWNEDPAKYISHALSPSKVVAVALSPSGQEARVVVPDHQLSLSIGKEGQNARLAARLTGWRIDIKSESQARGTDFLIFPAPEKSEDETAEMEAAYADFYETPEETTEQTTQETTEQTSEQTEETEYTEYENEYYYDEETGKYYYYDEETDEYYYFDEE
ncbi:MAG: transcription termination factor NusA [Clostridiales bacterium]|jgi:N utilization substance protein A|nr:transcription termination factor NusA [Clostridiales bacterium]